MMATPDKKDKIILKELTKNSRESIRAIAKKTNLRPSTVHQRIQKLKEDGVIEKFTVKLNNELFGRDFIAFMLLSTKNDLEAEFINNENVYEIFGVTGEYDLLVKMKFSDVNQFNNYLIKLRKNKDILKSVSMISTINLKEEI